MAFLTTLFLLSTIFLGIALGVLLPRQEIATLLVLLSSLPVIFSSGVIWPAEAIPAPILSVVQLVPAIPAIKAFVLLNQMGSDPHQLTDFISHMGLLTVFYGILAYVLLKRKISQQNRNSVLKYCTTNYFS